MRELVCSFDRVDPNIGYNFLLVLEGKKRTYQLEEKSNSIKEKL